MGGVKKGSRDLLTKCGDSVPSAPSLSSDVSLVPTKGVCVILNVCCLSLVSAVGLIRVASGCRGASVLVLNYHTYLKD